MNKPLRGIIHVYCRINGFFLTLVTVAFKAEPKQQKEPLSSGNVEFTITVGPQSYTVSRDATGIFLPSVQQNSAQFLPSISDQEVVQSNNKHSFLAFDLRHC